MILVEEPSGLSLNWLPGLWTEITNSETTISMEKKIVLLQIIAIILEVESPQAKQPVFRHNSTYGCQKTPD
jgi:hypothetical protein